MSQSSTRTPEDRGIDARSHFENVDSSRTSRSSTGASMIEYILLASFILLVTLAAVTVLGIRVSELFHENEMSTAFAQ